MIAKSTNATRTEQANVATFVFNDTSPNHDQRL
jgi:hypothetical protein